jgi:assimilatory nitrate reductase catalytic subunit
LRHDAQGLEHLEAFWWAGPAADGDTGGDAWLRTLLEADAALPLPGRQLLSPRAQALLKAPPAARSPQVCACFNVNEAAICQQLALAEGTPEQRLAQLQSALHCGTQCGSCLPTLRSLERAVVGPAPSQLTTASTENRASA